MFCIVFQLFCIDKSVPMDCCRLVKFDEYQDTLECSFENEEDTPMGVLLGGVKQTYNFDLLLETKRPDQVFQEYRPGGRDKDVIECGHFSCVEHVYIGF